MAKALNVLDGAALMLTGGGLLGGALAAIDIFPSPTGVVCAVAVGVGVAASATVRVLRPKIVEDQVERDDLVVEPVFNYPHDSLRIKNAGTDPTDPGVPGTLNWQATQSGIAKTF
jgi:hypothetical protein